MPGNLVNFAGCLCVILCSTSTAPHPLYPFFIHVVVISIVANVWMLSVFSFLPYAQCAIASLINCQLIIRSQALNALTYSQFYECTHVRDLISN